MAVTPAQIKARFEQFCDTDADKVTAAIAQAEGCINRGQWGENRADEAALYLAAHFLIVNPQGSDAAPGPRTTESEGQISAAYAIGDELKSVFGSTGYGRHYLELRRTAFPERF